MLSYLVLHDRTMLWVSAGGGRRMVSIPAGAERMARLVGDFEAAIRRGADDSAVGAAGRELHALLVAPAASELAGAREVALVTDGVLGRLPFAALRDDAGRYLVERVALRHAVTTSAALRAPPTPPAGVTLVVSDPAFDRARFPELEPLRSADRELAEVVAVRPGSTVLRGGAASKPAVTRALRDAAVLHFAGHARMVARAPATSHLVLAAGAADADAGVLSAAEIERLDLRRLGLVILSACGTTQSRSPHDDAEGGLAEAFLDAGARAVISSLWAADDAGTAALMGALHRELAAGVGSAEALRRAQVSMLRADAASRAPRAWSAFRYASG